MPLAKEVRLVRARVLVDRLGRERVVRPPERADEERRRERNEEKKRANRYCWP